MWKQKGARTIKRFGAKRLRREEAGETQGGQKQCCAESERCKKAMDGPKPRNTALRYRHALVFYVFRGQEKPITDVKQKRAAAAYGLLMATARPLRQAIRGQLTARA